VHHLIHEIFIYGYDREAKVFYTSDNSDNHKYSNKLISYTDIEKSYAEVVNNFMQLSQVKACKAPDIDMQIIKSSVSDYVSSKRDFNDFRYSSTNTYGVCVYEKYIDMLHSNERLLNDFRPLHLFWEHKMLMQKRIEFLMGSDYLLRNQRLLDEYAAIVRKFLLLRNLQIRYTICRKEEIIIKLISSLQCYVREETQLLNEVFK
jgi:hypothetical protein